MIAKKFWCVSFFYVSVLIPLAAATTSGPEVLRLDPSARSRALGGADMVWGRGGHRSNPAALERASERETVFFHQNILGEFGQDAVTYVHPRWRAGEKEVWGVSMFRLDGGKVDVFQEGAPLGTKHPQEWMVSFTGARLWGPAVWGLSANYVRQKIYAE